MYMIFGAAWTLSARNRTNFLFWKETSMGQIDGCLLLMMTAFRYPCLIHAPKRCRRIARTLEHRASSCCLAHVIFHPSVAASAAAAAVPPTSDMYIYKFYATLTFTFSLHCRFVRFGTFGYTCVWLALAVCAAAAAHSTDHCKLGSRYAMHIYCIEKKEKIKNRVSHHHFLYTFWIGHSVVLVLSRCFRHRRVVVLYF